MTDIDVLLTEERSFPPPPAFARDAHVNSPAIYEKAAADFEGFWAERAHELELAKAGKPSARKPERAPAPPPAPPAAPAAAPAPHAAPADSK